MKAINNLVEAWYTPTSEKDAEVPTRFRIKPLNGEQYMTVMMETRTNESGDLSLSASGMRQAINYGLVGWENFTDGAKDVPFSKASISLIPAPELIALASEIINRSSISEEQEKN